MESLDPSEVDTQETTEQVPPEPGARPLRVLHRDTPRRETGRAVGTPSDVPRRGATPDPRRGEGSPRRAPDRRVPTPELEGQGPDGTDPEPLEVPDPDRRSEGPWEPPGPSTPQQEVTADPPHGARRPLNRPDVQRSVPPPAARSPREGSVPGRQDRDPAASTGSPRDPSPDLPVGVGSYPGSLRTRVPGLTSDLPFQSPLTPSPRPTGSGSVPRRSERYAHTGPVFVFSDARR